VLLFEIEFKCYFSLIGVKSNTLSKRGAVSHAMNCSRAVPLLFSVGLFIIIIIYYYYYPKLSYNNSAIRRDRNIIPNFIPKF